MLFKKLIILPSIYTALCFVGIFIFSLFLKNIPPLLDNDIFSYKVLWGLSFFFETLPSILTSIFFVVVAAQIDKDNAKNINAFSSGQMKIFQVLILVACVNVILLFCASEIFQPMINKAQIKRENRYNDYVWYMNESTYAYEEGDVLSALHYVNTALELNPTSQESLDLKEIYERAPAEKANEVPAYFPEISAINLDDETEKAMTVLSLLERAQKAFDQQNYFDAHYYAFVGLEIGGVNNSNSADLQRISVEAWDILEKWSGFETDENMEIFALKQQGYASLIEGDSLSAYYTYLDLNKSIPYDPDVRRYFELSKEALLNEYFFIDETENLIHFESAKNIEFSVLRKDGLFYEITIGGITNVESAGEFLKYLRNYACTVKDSSGKVVYAFSVPYVKLIGIPLSSFNEDTVNMLNLEKDALVPRLLLTSVDRNTNGLVSSPVFSLGSTTIIDDSVSLLPMSLDDFELIVKASVGPEYINLASLYEFIPKADQYGFSSQVYSAYFLQRVSFPFLVLSIYLFLAIQAWNYRLSNGFIFKYYWVIIVPLFTVVAEFIRVLISYGMILVSLSLAKLEGMWQIPATIGIYVAIIILFSARFLALHTKPVEK